MSIRPAYVSPDFRGGCKIFPEPNAQGREPLLLVYQARWVLDRSRIKVGEKSRQIGWSWSEGYSIVRDKSVDTARLDQWVSSRDEIQARLFLNDVVAFAKLLSVGAQDLGQQVIEPKDGVTAHVVSFASGPRCYSMSSNPDAQAGKRGGRTLDEFALHKDQRKLYSIAYPGITWGGSLSIFSTHRGSGSFFNSLIKEIREGGNKKRASLHRVTLQDALEAGFLYKLQKKLSLAAPSHEELDADTRHLVEMDEAAYFDYIRAGAADEETFLQEYMCVPADDNTAFLTYDLIATCELEVVDDLKVETEEVRDYRGRKGQIRRLQNLSLAAIAALPFDLYLGVDVGRDHDLTVLWLAARIAGVLVPVAIVEMHAVEFSRQEAELYAILEMPNLRRGCFDNTGIGKQFGERAQQRFRHKVELITFSMPVKEELAFPVRSAFEDRSLRVPRDKKVISDLRAIKKETTAGDNIRFSADRGKNGHADRFWGLALCVHAAKPGGIYVGAAEHIQAWGQERAAVAAHGNQRMDG